MYGWNHALHIELALESLGYVLRLVEGKFNAAQLEIPLRQQSFFQSESIPE